MRRRVGSHRLWKRGWISGFLGSWNLFVFGTSNLFFGDLSRPLQLDHGVPSVLIAIARRLTMESACVMFVCVSVPPNEDAIPVSTRKRSLAVQLRSVGCATRDIWQSTWPCVLVYGSHATQSQQQCDCSLAAPAQSQAGRRRARSAKAPAPAAAGFLERADYVLVGAIVVVPVDSLATTRALALPLYVAARACRA